MRSISRLTLATAMAFCASGAIAGTMDSSISIHNQSSWEIHQIYLSPIDQEAWGEDLLRGKTIDARGGILDVKKIACDTYDVRLVDEQGAVCIVRNANLCADTETWVFDDEELLACQAVSVP